MISASEVALTVTLMSHKHARTTVRNRARKIVREAIGRAGRTCPVPKIDLRWEEEPAGQRPYDGHMSPTPTAGSDTAGTTWASLVRWNRGRLGLTQDRLAEQLGVSRKTITRWESGTNRPDTIELARKAVWVLGMDQISGMEAAGYGLGQLAPDPYAYIREMGLDPNSRTVRYILSLDISDETRAAALRRERLNVLRDEARRLEDLQYAFGRDVG